MSAATRPTAPPTSREIAIAALAATAFFVLAAWPWLHMAADAIPDRSRIGNPWWGADARLIVWTLAWDLHALLHQPLGLFDAPIFHPAPGILTATEHHLAALVLFAPVYLASGNPLLAANLTAFATYPLAALAMYVLARRLAYPPAASFVAAIALPLGPLRMPPDLHVIQYPNCLLALLVLVAVGARNGGLGRVVAVTLLAAFSSYYMAAMAAVVLAVEVALATVERGLRAGARLAGAAGVAYALLGLFSIPYAQLHALEGPVPALRDTVPLARALQTRLLDPADLAFGAGWGVSVLAVIGLAAPIFRRQAPSLRWWRWTALTLAGGLFAAGSAIAIGDVVIPLPYYVLLHTPLRALRGVSRFVVPAHFGMVGLAAEGASLLLAGAGCVPWATAARAALTASLVAAVALPRALALGGAPLTRLPTRDTLPEVYGALAALPPGPLLEIPGPVGAAGDNMLAQADAMYLGTYHWRPLVNGHAGYRPWWWATTLVPELMRIPDPSALQTLVDLTGVRWILVRSEATAPKAFARWRALPASIPEVTVVWESPHEVLLGVDLRPRRPWAATLADGPPAADRTLLGTPRVPLGVPAALGRIAARPTTLRVGGGRPLVVNVTVWHDGTSDWPVLAPPGSADDGLVVVAAAWRLAGVPVGPVERLRLPRDVMPGERLSFALRLQAPPEPATYALELALRQVGGTAFASVRPAVVDVTVLPPEPAASPSRAPAEPAVGSDPAREIGGR